MKQTCQTCYQSKSVATNNKDAPWRVSLLVHGHFHKRPIATGPKHAPPNVYLKLYQHPPPPGYADTCHSCAFRDRKMFYSVICWFLVFCHTANTPTCTSVVTYTGAEAQRDEARQSGKVRFHLIYRLLRALLTQKHSREELLVLISGIKYNTLVSNNLQTLAMCPNIMSGVKYNAMRCQSARRGCKITAPDAAVWRPSEQSKYSTIFRHF